MKIKPLFSLLLVTGLSACNTTGNNTVSAEQQVDGLKQMCADNADAMKARQEAESLYSRLGGTEGIATFSKRLLETHKLNDKISHMFKDVPEQPFVDDVTNFLVVHSGGEGEYTGRNVLDVHKELSITNEDFLVAGGDVQAVMTELGAGENEIQEAVCFLVSYIPQVVTQ